VQEFLLLYLCPREKFDPPASIRVSRVTAALSGLSCNPQSTVTEPVDADGADKSEEDVARDEILNKPAERRTPLRMASSY
jgi:hypothetical protein